MPRFAVAHGRDLLTFLFVIDILVLGAVPADVSDVFSEALVASDMSAMLSFFSPAYIYALCAATENLLTFPSELRIAAS